MYNSKFLVERAAGARGNEILDLFACFSFSTCAFSATNTDSPFAQWTYSSSSITQSITRAARIQVRLERRDNSYSQRRQQWAADRPDRPVERHRATRAPALGVALVELNGRDVELARSVEWCARRSLVRRTASSAALCTSCVRSLPLRCARFCLFHDHNYEANYLQNNFTLGGTRVLVSASVIPKTSFNLYFKIIIKYSFRG